MNKRLDYLLRKNQGDKLIEKYRQVMRKSGLRDDQMELLDLQKFDDIINGEMNGLKIVEHVAEQLDGSDMFFDSDSMRQLYFTLTPSEKCYIFNNMFKFCGAFLVQSKRAIEVALLVAKHDEEHTCFLLDGQFRYSFTIDYHEDSLPDQFDIRFKKAT